MTSRVFPGCYNDVKDGEKYQAEYSAHVMTPADQHYMMYWMFTDVRGEEGDEDGYPWGNSITHVEEF